MHRFRNTINIRQTQKGGNKVHQAQTIYINGDGNHVTGIHTDANDNVIEHINHGKITVDKAREDILKFHEEVAPKGVWSDWTLDDDVAVENMKKEDERNQLHNLLRKTYHSIKNSDPEIDKVDRLEYFLHFENTEDFHEGYVLKSTVNGTNVEETYRILPAFFSKKFHNVFKNMAYTETDVDPIHHGTIYRAYNIYYRCSDGLVFYLIGTDSFNPYKRIPSNLNDCKLIKAKYLDNDTSYILVYDPKIDLIACENTKATITGATRTNSEKFITLVKDMKWDLIAAVAGLILYFILH